jgi:hypothetical protein
LFPRRIQRELISNSVLLCDYKYLKEHNFSLSNTKCYIGVILKQSSLPVSNWMRRLWEPAIRTHNCSRSLRERVIYRSLGLLYSIRFGWYISVSVVILLRPGEYVDSRQEQVLFHSFSHAFRRALGQPRFPTEWVEGAICMVPRGWNFSPFVWNWCWYLWYYPYFYLSSGNQSYKFVIIFLYYINIYILYIWF